MALSFPVTYWVHTRHAGTATEAEVTAALEAYERMPYVSETARQRARTARQLIAAGQAPDSYILAEALAEAQWEGSREPEAVDENTDYAVEVQL